MASLLILVAGIGSMTAVVTGLVPGIVVTILGRRRASMIPFAPALRSGNRKHHNATSGPQVTCNSLE